MKIIVYHDKYKDKMISMIQEARKALSLSDIIRDDLYDVQASYLDKGDLFWLAVDESDSVVGCLGFSRIGETDEAFLHRFYVKASMKRQGVGTLMLRNAEKDMKERGVRVSKVHLGSPKEQWFESYAFYAKHGYVEYEPRYMKKSI